MLYLLLSGQYALAQAGNGSVINSQTERSDDIHIDNSNEDALIISNTENIDENASQMGSTSGSLPFQEEVLFAAKKSDIEPALIHAVIATESAYNPKARSVKGAYGLMQLLPSTARLFSTIPLSQWSVHEQVLIGSRYLKYLMNMFNGDIVLTVAAYNAGPQAVKNSQGNVPPFTETQRYVPRVLRRYHQLQKVLTSVPNSGQATPM